MPRASLRALPRLGLAAGIGALAWALVACSAPPTPPDVTVLRWMQAFANQDGDTLAQLTCQAGQSDNQNSRLLSQELGIASPNYGGGGQLPGGGGGPPTYDVSQLEYQTVFADQQSARVQVSGFLRMLSGLAQQIVPLSATVSLTREHDQWRVCG